MQPHVDIDERPVSSSAIRDALSEGQIADATAMLGDPWFVTGEVIHGEKRGRELGYPTANIRLDNNCGLSHGIYAVRVGRGAERIDGVASFGRRPTFDNGAPLLEIFLFDFKGDLYGEGLDVAFIGFIRDELKFASVDALVKPDGRRFGPRPRGARGRAGRVSEARVRSVERPRSKRCWRANFIAPMRNSVRSRPPQGVDGSLQRGAGACRSPSATRCSASGSAMSARMP